MGVLSKEELIAGGVNDAIEDWLSLNGFSPIAQTISTSTFTYTGDVTKFYLMDSVTDQQVIIDKDLNDLPVGSVITFVREGTGEVTFVGADGVIINTALDELNIAAQYGVMQLLKTDSNVFIATGG